MLEKLKSMLTKKAEQGEVDETVATESVEEVKEAEPLDPEALLEVRHLQKYFPIGEDFFGRPTNYLKAVDDVSFKIKEGTTLGIVGESGCGKTTLGRTILRLHPATSGEIYFKGIDINTLGTKELNALRPEMQIIFQDPYSSLSPRMPIGEIIGEAVAEHGLVPREQLKKGDLLFFPGHVAMYMGDGLYCHSTAHAGDDGFTINSLDPASPVYREDLVSRITQIGSYFA